jgi:hypothetical protein
MSVVLGHVVAQVDSQAGELEAVRPAVIVDRAVADRAGGQLGVGPGSVAVWEAASTAERGVGARGGRTALEAGRRDHES